MITMVVMLLTTLSASLAAAPVVGYSINSDSGTVDADSLYQIDLATGLETRIGKVTSLNGIKIDVEGLAFAPNGTLYGVDDSSMTLFPLNTGTGQVQNADEVFITGLPTGGGNDFGMTFACDGNLYLTSVAKGSLYRMDLDGTTTLIGTENSLGIKISALAAYGNPVRLYGLGNGVDAELKVSTPNLYEIDPATGIASEIGPLGPAAGNYTEAGLAFDDTGQLWAIVDRRQLQFPSQVMRVNTSTGAASDVKNTAESGFESLAITVPEGCAPGGGDKQGVEFRVTQQWLYKSAATVIDDTARINLYCANAVDGDGADHNGTMRWSWILKGDGDNRTATVYPRLDGSTNCRVERRVAQSAVESDNDCSAGVTVQVGDGPHLCTVTSVVFDEGIPTLNQYGLLLFSALMLLTGMVATRRF
ncbi:MAG: IPTL-CTERM sorting domain-containing protein [Xanthomonadales bacterium]